MKVNLLDLDSGAMGRWFASIGEKPFRARQVLRWIHQRGAQDFDAMTDIARSLRERLAADAEMRTPEIVGDSTSADGTRKWLLKIDGANAVDSVYIPETGRGTLCISSQAGCTLDCAFCSTGKQGFNRNLTTAEIVSQLWIANRLLGRKQGAARPVNADARITRSADAGMQSTRFVCLDGTVWSLCRSWPGRRALIRFAEDVV